MSSDKFMILHIHYSDSLVARASDLQSGSSPALATNFSEPCYMISMRINTLDQAKLIFMDR